MACKMFASIRQEEDSSVAAEPASRRVQSEERAVAGGSMPGRRKEAGIAPACCEEIAGGLWGSSSLLAERRQSGHQRRHAASKPAVRQHVEGRIIPGQAEAQVTAVQAGLGIAQLATWVVGTAIAPRQSGDRSSGPGDPGFASAYRVAAQPGAFGQGAGGGGAFRKDSGHWRRDREVIVLHCLLGPVHIQSVSHRLNVNRP